MVDRRLFTTALLVAALVGIHTATASHEISSDGLDRRPVIGILTQPTGYSASSMGNAYILASYIKFTESAGARVIPIHYDDTLEDIILSLDKVNGVLLPGGGSSTTSGEFADSTRLIVDIAISKNLRKEFFPVWGTCQGFEQLLKYMSQDENLLKRVDTEGYIFPLDFVGKQEAAAITKGMPKEIFNDYATKNITVNMHEWGVLLEDFENSEALSSNFKVVATNRSPTKGSTFVSLVEGIDYPFFASQFHPEKNAHEWEQSWEPKDENNDVHSPAGIMAAQYLANFFVNVARQTKRANDPIPDEFIANYPTTFTAFLDGSHSWETYYFDSPRQILLQKLKEEQQQ